MIERGITDTPNTQKILEFKYWTHTLNHPIRTFYILGQCSNWSYFQSITKITLKFYDSKDWPII